MRGVKEVFIAFGRKISGREAINPAGGIPYVLGQGINSPFIKPELEVHWHPPFSVADTEEKPVKSGRFLTLLTKLGILSRSA